MPLLINLRHLEAHNLQLKGELPVRELEFDTHDEMIHPADPLRYDFEVQKLDRGLLAQGRLELTLRCDCVRCLKPFAHRIRLDHWTRHLVLEGEEAAPVVNDCVDLTPYIREDILLEFPQHPLCKADCSGLPKTTGGKPNNTDPRQKEQKTSAWAELDKLKF
jgi:uncharacterized protein